MRVALSKVTVAVCAALLMTGCAAERGDARAAERGASPSPSPSPSASASPTPTPTPSVKPTLATRASARAKPPPARITPTQLPLRYGTGSATQVITVVARSTGSTTAIVQAWDKTTGGWLRIGPAIPANIGRNGMADPTREGLGKTPMGSFTLTQAFGRAGDPGTRLPYFATDYSDWWVSDQQSASYNTHYRCASNCPFNTSAGEQLHTYGSVYDYAVVMDYNRFPVVRGAGSAFFLHVTRGGSTAGCVAVSRSRLIAIMRWLNPAAQPRILVGTA